MLRQYDPDMTKRITVSLPDDVAAYLDNAINVSAVVAEAVRAQMDRAAATEDLLRAVGFDDTGILQITLIASWFNYINRVADALGVGRRDV